MPEANTSPPTDDDVAAPGLPRKDEGDEPRAGTEEAGGAEEEPTGKRPESREGHDGDGSVREGAGEGEEAAEGEGGEEEDPPRRSGLTPRQARRVRGIVSGVVMAAVAVALVVRVRSAPSLLTVAFYGVALILSGSAVGLSGRGRTRVATAVLALGFASVALAEWLPASVV